MDQRTFDASHHEVGLDDDTHDQVWSDFLAVGKHFFRNIADPRLGKAMQSRRGEIIGTRSQRTQDTRALPYKAAHHEKPAVTLPYTQADNATPRESAARSMATAKHDRHTRVFTPGRQEHAVLKARSLARGGLFTNLKDRYQRRSDAADRLERMKQNIANQRRSQPPTDDIKF
jgi:hypothetical protein